ncbi:MAG TPA: hypothetical protein PLX69_22590 [Leptospiraceae bacterium]|nr:hypothetical protein [Leptospiraceae bacterium]HRG77365.1 hypothetical protein [Leptospiraceae bacterium]
MIKLILLILLATTALSAQDKKSCTMINIEHLDFLRKCKIAI